MLEEMMLEGHDDDDDDDDLFGAWNTQDSTRERIHLR